MSDENLKLTTDKLFLQWKVSELTFEPSNWEHCLPKKGERLQARPLGKAVNTETQRLKEWKTESFKDALRNNLQKKISLHGSLFQHFTRVPFSFTLCQESSFSTYKNIEIFS